jgi:NADP-dependent 3-hydroxy acid dehydrogenase YdfG
MSLTRIAAVTGASSGIGRATARVLAEHGAGVVLAGRDGARLSALSKEWSAEGLEVLAVPGDVTVPGAVAELFASSRRRWHRHPDIAVLSAGRGLPGTVLSSDSTRWRELIDVNYAAMLHQLREAATLFLAAEDDAVTVRDIVVIGSTVGRQVSAANPVYGSTKFAVHALTEALRQEVCGRGIRVSLVEPGFVKSGFQATAGYDPNWFGALEADIGPMLKPDDVARTVDFIVHQPPHVHLDEIRIRPTRQQI